MMRHVFVLVLLVFLVAPPAVGHAQVANDQICFPEAAPAIRDCVERRFAQFWRANGGLAVFGYPISAAQSEVNTETGQAYLTQYFERQRFEYHPEHPAPYDVQLGRLGDAYLRHTGRDWQNMPKATPATHHYQAATGHSIAPEFYAYYRSYGVEFGDAGVSDRESLALFGYPISEPFREDTGGQQLLVQYFERARLEFHPDNPAGYRVLQGLLSSHLQEGSADHHDAQPAHDPNDDTAPHDTQPAHDPNADTGPHDSDRDHP